MDDFVKLYVQAAADGKLKVYDEDIGAVVYPDELIEPTCISDIESIEMQSRSGKLSKSWKNKLQKNNFGCLTINSYSMSAPALGR